MPDLFRTRITELYGIRLPIIASGLMWLADPETHIKRFKDD